MAKNKTSFGTLRFATHEAAKAAMFADEIRLGQWFRVDGEEKACRYLGAAKLRGGQEAMSPDALSHIHAFGKGRRRQLLRKAEKALKGMPFMPLGETEGGAHMSFRPTPAAEDDLIDWADEHMPGWRTGEPKWAFGIDAGMDVEEVGPEGVTVELERAPAAEPTDDNPYDQPLSAMHAAFVAKQVAAGAEPVTHDEFTRRVDAGVPVEGTVIAPAAAVVEDYAVTAATLVPTEHRRGWPKELGVPTQPDSPVDPVIRRVWQDRIDRAKEKGCKARTARQWRRDGHPYIAVTCDPCGRTWHHGDDFSEESCPQRNPSPPGRGFRARIAKAFRMVIGAPHRRSE